MPAASWPRVGEERVYEDTLGVLYPGEEAQATVLVDVDGSERTGYLVRPLPGWHARWLRVRYRLFRLLGIQAGLPVLRARGFVIRNHAKRHDEWSRP